MRPKGMTVIPVCFFLGVGLATSRADILVDHQPHPYGGFASDTLFTDPFGHSVWQLEADDFQLPIQDQASSLQFWGFYDADNPPLSETKAIGDILLFDHRGSCRYDPPYAPHRSRLRRKCLLPRHQPR